AQLSSGMDVPYASLQGVTGSPWFGAIQAIRSALVGQNMPPVLAGFQLTTVAGATDISATVSSSLGLSRVEWYVAPRLSSTSAYFLFALPATVGASGELFESWNYIGYFPSDGTNLSLVSLIFAGTYQSAGQSYNLYMLPAHYTPPGGLEVTGAV